nr:MAG TPA: hypothetical protein [Caudoviricetes sp.]
MPIGFSSGRLSLGTSLSYTEHYCVHWSYYFRLPIAYLSVLSCCVQLDSQGLSIALNQKRLIVHNNDYLWRTIGFTLVC